MRFQDITGQRFGKWEVVERAETARGMTRWLCRCACGAERTVFGKHLRSGQSAGCHPCSVKAGQGHVQWKGVGEISGDWWSRHTGRTSRVYSRRQGLVITITVQDAWDLFLAQGRKCALTGLDLHFTHRGGTASLDRIDSAEGYVAGNVQWVHKDVNRMKNAFSQQRFVEVCGLVAGLHGTSAISMGDRELR
jgi:hypothetical protein